MTGRQYVLIVPDGAGDRHRVNGRSPLAAARTPHMDFLAREGACGLMTTLYDSLPRESLVAQLGMLGWDPRRHYPGGRASCELLALGPLPMEPGDLAFRANLARMEDGVLASYNAGYILDGEAAPLVARVDGALRGEFPDFELRHNSDFRAALVLRGAQVGPGELRCAEPHESHGLPFDTAALVRGTTPAGERVAARMNAYLARAAALLAGERANALFPWSASTALCLPPFGRGTRFAGRAAVVGAMDFLCGIARAGGMEFHRVGTGRPETDFAGKGQRTVELLDEGCDFVFCHVNAPDEASHMQDVPGKIRAIERTDEHVVGPVVDYFRARPVRLGAVMLLPDHYSNSSPEHAGAARSAIHSADPVPFALWNGRDRDGVTAFHEDAARDGRWARDGLTHLDLLGLMGIGGGGAAAGHAIPLPAPALDRLLGAGEPAGARA